MFKVSNPGKNHGHIMFVAVIHRVGIANRTTGLNDRRDSCFVSNLNAIGEREERIGSHH